MTEENANTNEPAPDAAPEPAAAAPPEPTPEAAKHEEKSVILVSYPKIVFLYPTLIVALICGMYMWISGAKDSHDKPAAVAAEAEPGEAAIEDADAPAEVRPGSHAAHVLARIFLLVLTINLVVISFDFPRTTSLTLFFFVVATAVIVWVVFRQYDLLPAVTDFINSITPFANAPFYFLFSLVMIGLYIGVAIAVRFDYWEVRPNELLHHHGVLSDLERFSAPNLRINKEINDVFEYLLLRSGRLILHPSNERRAIVLENVFFINRKEEQITRMLGALQVQVREQG